MAFLDYASNGYVQMDQSTVLETLEIGLKSVTPMKVVKSTAGQAGIAAGRSEASMQVKCAVPKIARERRVIVQKYQAKETITMTYRTANGEMKLTGKIQSTDFMSKVDEADEFSFDIIGIEEPIRDAV